MKLWTTSKPTYLTLLKNLNPRLHIALGKAIAFLRERNILIVGSGMSFYNLKTFFSNDIDSSKENEGFDHWLIETCIHPAILSAGREQRLIEWEKHRLPDFVIREKNIYCLYLFATVSHVPALQLQRWYLMR